MYLAVFHPVLFSAVDHGCRVYHEDDQYLQDFPSMYQELDRFPSQDEAQAFCDSQPTRCMETGEEILALFADPKARLQIYEDVLKRLIDLKADHELYLRDREFDMPFRPYLCYRMMDVNHPAIQAMITAGYEFTIYRDALEARDINSNYSKLNLIAAFPELIPPENWYNNIMWGASENYDLRINIVTKAIELVKELI